jgi:hypothetical protein
MKKKILVILVCMLMMVVTSFGVVGENVDMIQQKEPLPEESAQVVKVMEVPAPWMYWENGLMGFVLHEETEFDVLINHASYVILDHELPLEDLTLENYMNYTNYTLLEFNNNTIKKGETVEFNFEMPPGGKAILVRCSCQFSGTPDVIEAHFINEAVLVGDRLYLGFCNFEIHNAYPEEKINKFSLELHGNIEPDDVKSVYDPPGETYLDWRDETSRWVWWNGWGVTDDFQNNSKHYGIELVWREKDKDHYVEFCQCIHFGVVIISDAPVYSGALANIIWIKGKDCTTDLDKTMPRNKAINNPFLNWLQCHPSWFPLLQKLIQQQWFGL